MIDFEAYASDGLVHGQLELGAADRLTDLLNAAAELPVQAVWREDLGDGQVVEIHDLALPFADLCAVVATGPRGDPARRVRTVPIRVVADVGPYAIEGDAHGTPASDPLGLALRRWTPLTDAAVTYRRNGQMVTDRLAALILNPRLAGWLRPAPDRAGAVPGGLGSQPGAPAVEPQDLGVSLADVAYRYMSAYNSFATSVRATAARLDGTADRAAHLAFAAEVAAAASRLRNALKAIPFHDPLKADADALVASVVVLRQCAVGVLGLTDAPTIAPAEAQLLTAMEQVASAAAITWEHLVVAGGHGPPRGA